MGSPVAVQTADQSAETDCMKAMEPAADDCCNKSDNQNGKSKCLFDDACAARCHINAAVVQTLVTVMSHLTPATVLQPPSPTPPYAERPGPRYRPPLV
jgi:hypothetical protein